MTRDESLSVNRIQMIDDLVCRLCAVKEGLGVLYDLCPEDPYTLNNLDTAIDQYISHIVKLRSRIAEEERVDKNMKGGLRS